MSLSVNTIVSSQGFEYGVKHFYNQKSGLVSEILLDSLQLSYSECTALLNLGAIYINNSRNLTDINIPANQLFRVHSKPRHYNCNYNWKNLVIYENQDFIVLNKPSGVPSHPSVDNIIENSLSQLSQAYNQEFYITHRLDTLTSGLIVYAKSTSFVKNFNKQLQEKNIEKKYIALVEATHNLPKKVIHYMEPSPRAPKKVSEIFVDGWAFCELDILEQKKITPNLSWLKINLLTGRTHQIRSQLANLQSPITGDTLYGAQLDYHPQAIA
ncbi:MAG: RluA family pseudouridine synthase, partial [Bdellovibrionales bacterium]